MKPERVGITPSLMKHSNIPLAAAEPFTADKTTQSSSSFHLSSILLPDDAGK